ncbi:MAG: UTP--glucose-1-phosphate uridylyltransferase [bacterium]|nr:UTP--glucose-1-phosphate uridylyltransferase [bacterium]
MAIVKAVVTAAGPDQRSLPLQGLIDRDGELKTALHIILEEALSAGIEETCVVVHPGDAAAYARAAEHVGARLTFVEQAEPRGYAHAIACAREFVGDEPFLHLVGDHLWVAHGERSCAQQLVALAEAESAAVSAVQATRETMLPFYGTVGGRRVAGSSDLYVVERVREKPTPTEAEQELIVPGLRAGHYLCFFGMHVLPPTIMDHIGDVTKDGANGGDPSLSSALSALAERETYLAHQAAGLRYNIGVKYGLLQAQLALALAGKDRDFVLTQLVELLAQPESGHA